MKTYTNFPTLCIWTGKSTQASTINYPRIGFPGRDLCKSLG